MACVCRELTKMHEETRLATLSELHAHYSANPPKGEIVVVIAPDDTPSAIDPDVLLTELLEQNSVSRAAAEAARLTGLSKRELYQRALTLSEMALPEGGKK
jgi:16S rRNA (cytidine1402-2'-O)-methyltransferase